MTLVKWESSLNQLPRMLAIVLLMGSALAQNVVHYTTTTANVKYLFATAEPALRLLPRLSEPRLPSGKLAQEAAAMALPGCRCGW
jgi:hypothetical protein